MSIGMSSQSTVRSSTFSTSDSHFADASISHGDDDSEDEDPFVVLPPRRESPSRHRSKQSVVVVEPGNRAGENGGNGNGNEIIGKEDHQQPVTVPIRPRHHYPTRPVPTDNFALAREDPRSRNDSFDLTPARPSNDSTYYRASLSSIITPIPQGSINPISMPTAFVTLGSNQDLHNLSTTSISMHEKSSPDSIRSSRRFAPGLDSEMYNDNRGAEELEMEDERNERGGWDEGRLKRLWRNKKRVVCVLIFVVLLVLLGVAMAVIFTRLSKPSQVASSKASIDSIPVAPDSLSFLSTSALPSTIFPSFIPYLSLAAPVSTSIITSLLAPPISTASASSSPVVASTPATPSSLVIEFVISGTPVLTTLPYYLTGDHASTQTDGQIMLEREVTVAGQVATIRFAVPAPSSV